jgi:hypothetical protein
LLSQAIKKYGRDNFVREIIAEFDTAEEAFALEAELVTEEFCNDPQTYNLTQGGEGGDRLTGNPNLEETKKKMSRARKGVKKSEEHRRKIAEGVRRSYQKNPELRELRAASHKNGRYAKT